MCLRCFAVLVILFRTVHLDIYFSHLVVIISHLMSFAQPVWRGESPGNGSWGNYRTSLWFWGFWWRCDINTHFFCAASIVYCTVRTGVSEARSASAFRWLDDLRQWLSRTSQGLQQSRCIFRSHPPEDGSKAGFRNAVLQLCSRRWAVQKEIVSGNVSGKEGFGILL